MNKRKICHLINNSLYSSFLLGQCDYQYDGLSHDIDSNDFKEHDARLKKYLKVNTNNIYLDNEVDYFLDKNKKDGYNAEFFYMNMNDGKFYFL